MTISRYPFRSRLTRRALVAAFVLAWLFVASGNRTLRAVEVIATFDSATLVANPNGWAITGLANTIDGGDAGPVFGRIFTGQQNATGVVIDYGFTVPREQITRLQLFNNGGGILTDLDGIGTALVEVFDPSNTLLFSGTLNGGNGGGTFELVFASPLNNVSRVRLSNITNLLGHAAPDIIWRELRAIQDLNPDIDLGKTVSGPIPLTVGATLTYAFVVTNTGNATLTNVTVTDPLPGMSAIACPGTILTPGADMTCTATYVVTQADVNAGFVTNTATAIGTPPSGLAPVSDQDSATIPPAQTRSIDLEKTASGPNASGQVAYSFAVTNTGTVTLTGVMVTDPLPGLSAVSCPATSLAPSVAMTCSATYTLTQADVNNGVVANTATAAGTPPSGPVVTDQSSAVVNVNVGIGLTKTGSGPDPLTVGATVNYTFLVANTGQLALTGVTVIDPLPGLSAVNCPATSLAPAASMTCTATYTVTQADANAGIVTNTATAGGTPPDGFLPVSAQSTASVPPTLPPAPVPTLPLPVLAGLAILLSAAATWLLRRRARVA